MIAAGHGWALAAFPLLAAVIALAFALRLSVRLADRWRWHEAVWAVALLMFAAASAAMFVGVLRGWHPADFRIYWLFGAVLNVPFLLAGEIYLLGRRRAIGHLFVAFLIAASAFAGWKVFAASVHQAPLSGRLPLGKDVFGDGSLPYRLAQYYSLPAYFLLIAGLVWSVLQMKGKPALRDRAAGTFGIALGATIVAIGSGIGAAFHVVPLFSVSLAAGVAVMFWGFLRASRAVRIPHEELAGGQR
ncbi:MAG: hypothetical protein E6G40_08815 [Actinobacteria bacterium]|nr:MAG: hypothetical protein E6G44_06430 [Actinomycetota bacterium]TMK97285.1 MAG: hypothetical protein E6G40_08815 [Actinomycetota bacterium]